MNHFTHWRSGVTLLVFGLLGALWLGWPLWSSFTAPDRDAVANEAPFILAAVLGLLALLGWAIWRDAGRRAQVFGPVILVAGIDVLLRLVLSPGGGGIEPVYALPLLAGAALGAPAGALTGGLAALLSATSLGLVDTPLVAQILAWGMWGVVGGALRHLRPIAAWLVAVVLALPLGMLTGVVLNISGWTGERDITTGGFLPGLPPLDAAQRLVEYTLTTSLAFDATRAVLNAIIVLAVGLPVLRALRRISGAPTAVAPGPVEPSPPDVSPSATRRRLRSDHLTDLWTSSTTTTQEK